MAHLTLDKSVHRAIHRGQFIELNADEFDVLWLLASQPGRTFSKDEILMEMSLENPDFPSNTFRQLMNRLIEKMGKRYLRMIRKSNYFLSFS